MRVVALPPGRDERPYWHCLECDLHFLDPARRVSAAAERARYDLHHYDPGDAGYFRFVSPLIERVRTLIKPGGRGLDFGAGRVPVLARYFGELGYDVSIYDVFYWPAVDLLRRRYEFVIACEVIEHLYDPAREFARLRACLRPGAPLILMTEPRRDEVDFESWSYRRDPTHVTFYSARTFRWLAETFGFKNMNINDRVITLYSPEA